MRIYSVGFVALFFAFGPAHAGPDSPASYASLRELLQVTQTHKVQDAMMAQVDGIMRRASIQAMAGHQIDGGAQKIIDVQTSKLNHVLMQQLDWKRLEPMYIDIYRKNFTQKEVDDMLAFYRSPSGQSMVAKLPAMMAQAMQMVQGMMSSLEPQIQTIMADTATSLSAYETSRKQARPHPSTGKASEQQAENAVKPAPKSLTGQMVAEAASG